MIQLLLLPHSSDYAAFNLSACNVMQVRLLASVTGASASKMIVSHSDHSQPGKAKQLPAANTTQEAPYLFFIPADAGQSFFLILTRQTYAMKKTLFVLLCVLAAVLSCKKESGAKSCWQAFDPAGYDATGLVLCDKTLAEAQELYPQYWFYKEGEEKFCWRTVSSQGYTAYARYLPESMVEKLKQQWGISFTKVDCNSFCTWTYQDKFQSKTTGQFSPTQQSRETYLADSCGKLYEGRVIVLKETADSVYTRVFVRKDS